jgi:hypothetical protein
MMLLLALMLSSLPCQVSATGSSVTSGYSLAAAPANTGSLRWTTLTNGQWTGLTNAQWTTLGN